MSERAARGIVLGHGAMAEGLVDAVRQITGVEENALIPLSNRGLSPETMAERIDALLAEGPGLLFTDLQSGSCALLAHRFCRDHPGVMVISGANLPMLLDFVMHRELPMDELVPRLLDRGRTAICCGPTHQETNAGRSLSGR